MAITTTYLWTVKWDAWDSSTLLLPPYHKIIHKFHISILAKERRKRIETVTFHSATVVVSWVNKYTGLRKRTISKVVTPTALGNFYYSVASDLLPFTYWEMVHSYAVLDMSVNGARKRITSPIVKDDSMVLEKDAPEAPIIRLSRNDTGRFNAEYQPRLDWEQTEGNEPYSIYDLVQIKNYKTNTSLFYDTSIEEQNNGLWGGSTYGRYFLDGPNNIEEKFILQARGYTDKHGWSEWGPELTVTNDIQPYIIKSVSSVVKDADPNQRTITVSTTISPEDSDVENAVFEVVSVHTRAWKTLDGINNEEETPWDNVVLGAAYATDGDEYSFDVTLDAYASTAVYFLTEVWYKGSSGYARKKEMVTGATYAPTLTTPNQSYNNLDDGFVEVPKFGG